MAASFKAMVQADSTGKWNGNMLRFSEVAEAEAYARDLFNRWTAVREWRVTRSDDAPTHRWDGDRATPIEQGGE
jgi:hypothetical protein